MNSKDYLALYNIAIETYEMAKKGEISPEDAAEIFEKLKDDFSKLELEERNEFFLKKILNRE